MNLFVRQIHTVLGITTPAGHSADRIEVQEWTHPNDPEVFVVAAWSAAARPACGSCLSAKVDHLWGHQQGRDTGALDRTSATDAVRASAGVGLALALTNAKMGQNWSVIAPRPGCRGCRSKQIDGRSWDPLSGIPAPAVTATVGDRVSGLPRSGDPAEFVGAHRAWFGFASALLNPSLASDAGVFTADTGMFLDDIEGIAPIGGKGTTQEQALASCLGEGIERFAIAGGFTDDRARARPCRVGDVREAALWRDAVDFGGRQIVVAHDDQVAMIEMEPLDDGLARAFPASLVFAPYEPLAGTVSVTPSSTTGAAVGRTVSDATLQAVLELIERDAFWFHSRVGGRNAVIDLDGHSLASDIMRATETRAHATLLENPFDVPVVHVSLERLGGDGSQTARGMGAAPSLAAALTRALIESVQMLRSLDTGIEVDESETDMRALWYDGRSQEVFPGLFGRTADSGRVYHAARLAGEIHHSTCEALLEEILRRARRAGVRFFRHILLDDGRSVAVRCLADRILPLDDLHFPALGRFGDWSERSTACSPTYTGPLFM